MRFYKETLPLGIAKENFPTKIVDKPLPIEIVKEPLPTVEDVSTLEILASIVEMEPVPA